MHVHTSTYVFYHTFVNVCMCACVCVSVCLYECEFCNYLMVLFLCMLGVYFFVCCLFHQSVSANCVLPTMYKEEAYISVSLLLPPFFPVNL